MQRLVPWRSVEFRLLSYYCLLLLVLGSVFSMLTVSSFDRFEKETVRADVTDRAAAIWALSNGLLDQPAQLRVLLERRFSAGEQDRFIRVSTPREVLYQSGRPTNGLFDPDRVPLPQLQGSRKALEYDNLYVFTRAFRGPEGGTIFVQSGQSTESVHSIRRNLISSLLLGLPVLLVCAGVGGYFLVRRALTPLSHMIRAAEAITFNDPHNRLPLTGAGDRLDGLGQALNRMLDRLDSAYQHASRFSSDAAHELRTPLAIIRGELEFIAQSELNVDARESLRSTLDEVRRLADMTEHLLTIASMDSVWGKKQHASVDLLELATETIEQMNLLAEEKQIELTIRASARVFVAGDRNRLKQVLVNLLDNAIKYTPNHGAVAVELQMHEGHVRVVVVDTGIGIPAEHLEDIFSRFFRVSTDRGSRGAGLGLSIARSICQAHGGTLTVQSEPGRGSQFQMELPLERA